MSSKKNSYIIPMESNRSIVLQIGDRCPAEWGYHGKAMVSLDRLAAVGLIKKGGWVKASICLPIKYDLCTLKTKDKEVPGWWNGSEWSGRKVKENEQVLFWKSNHGFN